MAKRTKSWVAPRGGGYTAVVKEGQSTDNPTPPRGPAAVTVPSAPKAEQAKVS